jgi:acyl-coenzyme A thioesterase PaaI-like protein
MPLPDDARVLWINQPPPERGPRAQKHQLVLEAKTIVERVALLDADRTDDGDLADLIEAADALSVALDGRPSLRVMGGLYAAGGEDAVLTERSGISGRSNPLAAPLHITVDGDVTRAWATFGAAYEGPRDCLHGGFVAAAFDDLLGCAQMTSGTAGFTGTLTVRMVAPTPLYRRIDYVAGVDRLEGRKIHCWGRSLDGDRVLAEATCVFITPAGGMVDRPPAS